MAQRRANNILQALAGVRQNREGHLAEMLHPRSPLQELLEHFRAQQNPFGGGPHVHPGPVAPHPIHAFGPGGAVTGHPVAPAPLPGSPMAPPPNRMLPPGDQIVHPLLQPVQPFRPADLLHALGNNAAAAAMWQQHHPGAMNGAGPIPGYVASQWANQAYARNMANGVPMTAAHPSVAQ